MLNLNYADLFCGGGGTTNGAKEAIHAAGFKPVGTAINHWPTAIATHKLNHPNEHHLCTSVDDVNPRSLYKPGELHLLWASPECTHHSRARGGKPMPVITRRGLLRYWNDPEIQIPRDPVFLLGMVHDIKARHQSPWHQLRIRRQLQLIGEQRLPRDTFKSIRAWEDPRAGKKRWIHPLWKLRK